MLGHKLTYGSVFSAVEFTNNSSFHLLSLKRKKNELDIIQKETFDHFESLITALKGKKHLFLILNSEKVLTKKVNFVHIAKESVVKAAFPNISIHDFYYEVFDNGSSSIVSICRKEVLKNTIHQFQEKGISIIQFSLGNTSFQKLLPFLNDFQFHTSNGVFDVRDHNVIDWGKSKEMLQTYEVNGLTVDSNQLLPLAGVISYCNGLGKSNEEGIQNTLVREYQQKKTFELGTRLGLGFLFVVLLANFLIFSSYNSQVDILQSELSMNEVYRKQLLRVNDLVGKKERLVESMDAVSNSKVIWYFDELAKSVPKTISLDNIGYQPMSRSIKKDKPIRFQMDEIIISGVTKNDTDLTRWVNSLEKKEWIDKVSIKDIGGENSKSTSFDFVIHLNPERK